MSQPSSTNGREGRWLHRHPAKGHQEVELVCLPYAGGSAATYFDWPRLLPDWVAVSAVQLPGRGPRWREPPPTDAHQVAEILADRLSRPGDDGRIALYGHSMGALLAFEIARRLGDLGRVPVRLFLAALSPPHRLGRTPALSRLPRPAFLEALRSFDGTPEEVLASPELMDLVLPALRADFRLCEDYRYRPGPPPATPIVAVGATDDRLVHRHDLEAWAAYSTAPLKTYEVTGGHFFLHTDPVTVTRLITHELAAAVLAPNPEPGPGLGGEDGISRARASRRDPGSGSAA